MADAYDIRAASRGDCKDEREMLRRISEMEARARAVVERDRRAVAERRAELEIEVAAQEEELHALKEEAWKVQSQVQGARREGREQGRSLVAMLPELEEAVESVQSAAEEVAAAKQQVQEEAEAHQKQLDMDRGLYQLYAASTGIRWDYDSEMVQGYVALDTARHFSLPEPSPSDPAAQASTADTLWKQMEACIGSSSELVDRPPWESRPGGAGGA